MPTYDYVCEGCQHRFEHFQSITSDPLKDCPSCSQPQLRRLIGTGGALIFKGSGFYCTDYKKPSGGKPDEKALDAKVEKAKDAAQATKSGSSESTSTSGAASKSA